MLAKCFSEHSSGSHSPTPHCLQDWRPLRACTGRSICKVLLCPTRLTLFFRNRYYTASGGHIRWTFWPWLVRVFDVILLLKRPQGQQNVFPLFSRGYRWRDKKNVGWMLIKGSGENCWKESYSWASISLDHGNEHYETERTISLTHYSLLQRRRAGAERWEF